jgi:hypothetical protein
MIKTTMATLATAALLSAGSAFAENKGDDAACCAKGASHKDKMACADFASLGVTAEQKSKLEAWSADCMKAGCTKEARQAFLKQAKGILSAEQFAKVKAQCKGESKDKSET